MQPNTWTKASLHVTIFAIGGKWCECKIRAEALQIILNVLELNPQLKTMLDSLA